MFKIDNRKIILDGARLTFVAPATGSKFELASDPAAHEQEWRAEERRLLAAWDTTEETGSVQDS